METALPLLAPARLLLIAHIAAGFTALSAGLVAVLARPGGRLHRRAGQAFAWAMAGVTLSALSLAVLRPNPFLFAVGIFSGFMVATGLRALRLKGLHRDQSPARLDWALWGLGLLGAGALLAQGLRAYQQAANPLGIVSAVFGVVMLGQSLSDWRRFTRRPRYALHWLQVHLGRMMGAFIATVTAFSAVNLSFLPTIVQWLWPTALGVVVIGVMRRRYAPGPKAQPTRQPELRDARALGQ